MRSAYKKYRAICHECILQTIFRKIFDRNFRIRCACSCNSKIALAAFMLLTWVGQMKLLILQGPVLAAARQLRASQAGRPATAAATAWCRGETEASERAGDGGGGPTAPLPARASTAAARGSAPAAPFGANMFTPSASIGIRAASKNTHQAVCCDGSLGEITSRQNRRSD